tara:strand:+ start:308 stop:523 length:216 start_codon:yes stop_codon:yes gene_type:complete
MTNAISKETIKAKWLEYKAEEIFAANKAVASAKKAVQDAGAAHDAGKFYPASIAYSRACSARKRLDAIFKD